MAMKESRCFDVENVLLKLEKVFAITQDQSKAIADEDLNRLEILVAKKNRLISELNKEKGKLVNNNILSDKDRKQISDIICEVKKLDSENKKAMEGLISGAKLNLSSRANSKKIAGAYFPNHYSKAEFFDNRK